mgnify:CR=1 FL=1
MYVVGGHDWDVQVPCQLHKPWKDRCLLRDEVVLDFNIVPVAKELLVPFGLLVGLVHVVVEKLLGDLARKAG